MTGHAEISINDVSHVVWAHREFISFSFANMKKDILVLPFFSFILLDKVRKEQKEQKYLKVEFTFY